MKIIEENLKLLCFFILIALSMGPGSQSTFAEDVARQAEVASRGAKVMPFSLSKSQHQLTKTDSGGIQRVIARDSLDQEQTGLIGQHLEQLANKFNIGDYSGPESIHGADMSGLAQFKKAKAGSMKILYAAEPAGASLTFQSKEARLVQAVHVGLMRRYTITGMTPWRYIVPTTRSNSKFLILLG